MRGTPEIDDSTAHSGESTRSHHSDGSTPKEEPPGGFLPAPIPTLCDHRVLTGQQLRSPTVVACFRNCATVACQILGQARSLFLEIAWPALTDFCPLPPGTSAALSSTNSRQLPGSILGVPIGRSRCNFAYQCRPMGERSQRTGTDPAVTLLMPKGPDKVSPYSEASAMERTATYWEAHIRRLGGDS